MLNPRNIQRPKTENCTDYNIVLSGFAITRNKEATCVADLEIFGYVKMFTSWIWGVPLLRFSLYVGLCMYLRTLLLNSTVVCFHIFSLLAVVFGLLLPCTMGLTPWKADFMMVSFYTWIYILGHSSFENLLSRSLGPGRPYPLWWFWCE